MLSTKSKEHIRRRLAAVGPRCACVGACLAAMAVVVGDTARHTRVVEIRDTLGESRCVITAVGTMEELYDLTGIAPAGQYDELYTTTTDDGVRYQILRAYTVPVTADGKTVPVMTVGGTVADILQEGGFTCDADDEVTPAMTAAVDRGTAITVRRVEYKEYTVQEETPAETDYIYTSLYWRQRFRDITRTVREGQNGVYDVTYRERYVDGALDTREEIARETVVEMVPSLVKCYGEQAPVSRLQGPPVVDGKPSTGIAAVYSGGRATGYSSGPKAVGASGRRLTYGTVAVNPALIPYGSLLYIVSDSGDFVYGYAYAADTGGALVTGHALVDLYYETREESYQNEVMSVTVYVLDSATAAEYQATNEAIIAADDIIGW